MMGPPFGATAKRVCPWGLAAMTSFPTWLIEQLRAARHIAILTGSGISTESGIPTFRDGQNSLWKDFDIRDYASVDGYLRNPQRVWDWYVERRVQMDSVEPNPGHFALAQMEQHGARVSILTQNIDGLHQRAGSSEVIELHGNIHRSRCYREHTLVDTWPETAERPPRCPDCGGPLRPDVVWFGEMLPDEALAAAERAARECDLFFSIGTSAVVYPAAALPLVAARRRTSVVEVNLEETPLTDIARSSFQGPAGRILPELVAAAWPE